LFDPLGISDVEWLRLPGGDVRGFGGLRLRPRDLAKIGQLMLDSGSWHARQIVPAVWIEQSTTPQINGDGLFFYGYQWWLGRSLLARREVDWTAGMGNGGQRLYIVPAEGIVIAVTAGLYNHMTLQWAIGDTVLNRHVLPAIKAR
jgi:CubicO group peptidase (beta-lactamase class C family)